MSDWQPMETAPKDGTRILIICMGAHVPEPDLVFWNHNQWCDGDPESWERAANLGFKAAYMDGDASHWMPLPAPPKL